MYLSFGIHISHPHIFMQIFAQALVCSPHTCIFVCVFVCVPINARKNSHFGCKPRNFWILMQWTIIILQSSSIFISLCFWTTSYRHMHPHTHTHSERQEKKSPTYTFDRFLIAIYRALFAPIKCSRMHRNGWITLFSGVLALLRFGCKISTIVIQIGAH